MFIFKKHLDDYKKVKFGKLKTKLFKKQKQFWFIDKHVLYETKD